MSNKTQQPETISLAAKQFTTIEKLRQLRQTPAAVFSGTCLMMGWKSGRAVTADEYDAAIKAFSNSPIGKAGK